MRASELHFSGVDWEMVMKRLVAQAYKLFLTSGLLRGEVLRPYGMSPEDLVFDAMKRLIDPHDTTVSWNSSKGKPTTEGVVKFLGTVVRHDFVDHRKARTQHARTQELVRRRGPDAGHEELAFDPPDESCPSEEDLLSKVNRERLFATLLDRAAGDAELEEYLLLQWCEGDYQALTPQEAASRLKTTAINIQNRKRRCLHLLKGIAQPQAQAAQLLESESEGSHEQE